MKNGLLEEIQKVGHWRVNVRPLADPAMLSLSQCRDIVERSSVSIRGWDFPHISRGEGSEGGSVLAGEYVENWTDWMGFKEFWRMYKSSQFLSYVSLREDTRPDEHGNPKVAVLNAVGAVYSVTEFIEFSHRLYEHGLYASGATVSVTLMNAENRHLTPGLNSIPFFTPKVTQAAALELRRSLQATELGETYRRVAVDMCVELFDHFGWNPDRRQIEADQEGFYRQTWRY